MDSTRLEDLEIRLFLEALYARYGYDLRGYAQASMRRRVLSTLAKTGFPHLGELQHQLLVNSELLAPVLDSLTVQVSDMFRDPGFYRAFRQEVVPHLRPYPQIRLWHAGCSSGEEIYSIAILLLEEELYDRSQIYATDLSPNALVRAKEGVYPAKRVASFTENYLKAGGKAALQRYYSEGYGSVAMHEALKKNIFFFQHNLISDHAFGEMQVVACRNVLLYFDRPARNTVFAKFKAGLCQGGFLVLGSAEQIPRDQPRFAEFAAREKIYRYWAECPSEPAAMMNSRPLARVERS